MARRWTSQEEAYYRNQLLDLYIQQNKTIRETGNVLDISEKTVFDRLKRLGVPTNRLAKAGACNRKGMIVLPKQRTEKLAEFFGIMLGNGHLSHFQTIVTLGTKELDYVDYVADLMKTLFGVRGTVGVRKDKYRDVYIGSVELTRWLRQEGLVSNKVAAQMGAPEWIFSRDKYMNSFLRGFFDTDGSIYRLKFGRQISLTNKSLPLLYALQRMLSALGYTPSEVGSYCVYLTRRSEIDRFFAEVRPANTKHLQRFTEISKT